MELVVATRNPHKLEEIRQILGDLPIVLRSALELGAPEVLEDRPTLEGNATKKAAEVARHARRFALADDTGLEVDALGGRPGVHSARYAGPGATYSDNCGRLLRELDGVPPERRSARFRCVIVVEGPPGRREARITATGVLEGTIALDPRGANGFGYDPIFLVGGDPRGRTLAELTTEEKNALSHRGRALAELREKLPGILASAGSAG